MSASPIKHEIKKEPIDNDIEILGDITYSNENSNNLMSSASFSVINSEFNYQTESNKDETIKKLEQMQEILFERIRIKTNENEILKQNETNLITKNNELNSIIETKTNDKMNLSNEIKILKENLVKTQETVESKSTEINDLKIKIGKYESKINEMKQQSKGILN
jgi:chromosome segregation ATPase